MDTIVGTVAVEAKANFGKSTARKVKVTAKATGPVRTVQFFRNPDDEYSDLAGRIAIAVDGVTTEYLVREFPTGWIGRGFTLFKIGADPKDYDVFVCQRGAEGDSCDCPDSIYRGRACKHLGAIRKLIEVGKL